MSWAGACHGQQQHQSLHNFTQIRDGTASTKCMEPIVRGGGGSGSGRAGEQRSLRRKSPNDSCVEAAEATLQATLPGSHL